MSDDRPRTDGDAADGDVADAGDGTVAAAGNANVAAGEDGDDADGTEGDDAECSGPEDAGDGPGTAGSEVPGESGGPSAPSESGARGDSDGPRRRDVEVPLRVYKTVTVFSTLFAVGAVVFGFVLLDRATQRATAAPEDVNALVALLGLGSIAAGAVVYAFSTRFRARGMGKPKDEAD